MQNNTNQNKISVTIVTARGSTQNQKFGYAEYANGNKNVKIKAICF